MLLTKDIHIAEKTERLEQNLVERDKIEDRNNNFDENFVEKEDKLII